MRTRFAALGTGVLFGVGLTVSEMVQPLKVVGFLDVAGAWDPTLALVMGGALAVTALAFPLILRRGRPLWADAFSLPTRQDLDARLVAGAALFGIGWGLAGYCPGPALASLALGASGAWIFTAAMVAGMLLHRLVFEGRAESARG
ncbi:MAG: DUF6691 family protein [Candidatus Limnocylindria bacterium]